MIEISIDGEDELSNKLTRLVETRGGLPRVLEVFADRIFNYALEGAGKHSKSGWLVRSLGSGAAKTGDLEYQISHDLQAAPQALFVNFGTRPHEIRPKQKKVLRWVNGGNFIFSKLVHHPGYKGDAYFPASTENALRDFDQIVSKYLMEN